MTDDDRRSISHEAQVPGTPEQVWEAIATGPGISAWFVPSEVEGREGGEAVFHLGPDMDAPATVTGWDPPSRFAYEEQWPVAEGAEPATLATEFLVEARAGGTCSVRVVSTFSAPGFDADLDSMESGWTSFLDTLRLYLEHFRGQPVAAVSLAREQDSEDKDAVWAAVLERLGLRDAEPGARVATPAGAPQLAGVVERRGDDELLVRTGDSLAGISVYRWDGRTVTAYRESCFGSGAEAAAAARTAAWDAWLG